MDYVPRFHRVYLVDDHDIVRRGLRDLLLNARDIDVVGDSASAQEAVPEILRLGADVMLLDLHLQDGSGVEVCRAVRSVAPSTSGLLLTASSDEVAMAAAVLAGAAGYLVKLSRNTDIIGAIRRVNSGVPLLDDDSAAEATDLLRSVTDALAPPLDDLERRILDLVVEGRTDREVVDALLDQHGAHQEADPQPDQETLAAATRALVARVADTLVGSPAGSPALDAGRRHRRDWPTG